MEQNRENESRGGHPGGSMNESGMQRAEQGFEGMNFEQHREPYKSRQQQYTRNKGNNASGAFEHNGDDR